MPINNNIIAGAILAHNLKNVSKENYAIMYKVFYTRQSHNDF